MNCISSMISKGCNRQIAIIWGVNVMNTDALVRIVAVVAVIGGGLYFFMSGDDNKSSEPDVADLYLGRVLDITVDTIVQTDKDIKAMPEDKRTGDQPFLYLADKLAVAYNSAEPVLESDRIGVSPLKDASLLAYADTNKDDNFDRQGENALFLIEVDGENSRVIATNAMGAVHDRAFSGSGMLTGFLIGNMLSRQSSAGATAGVMNKKTVSATQARARSRAGSGSHSRGK